MKKRYQYILFILLITIVYEVYLVVLYKYKDFQINSYITYVTNESDKIVKSTQEKKDYLSYIKTNAFLDRMAKSSQNKKNPGEILTVLVTPEEAEEYKKIDTDKQIIGEIYSATRSRTYGMTNVEKWAYYIFHTDLRED